MKAIIYLSLLILVATGCKDKDRTENNVPDPFEVSAVTRGSVSADLKWTAATDPEGDSITYAIEINGQKIVSGVTTNKFKLTGLKFDSTYQGKVIASDQAGLFTTANFQVLPHDGQILAVTGNILGGILSLEQDGAVSWRFGRIVSAVPAVVNDTIFAGSDVLYAADAIDGRVLWANTSIPGQALRTALLYHQGKLFFRTNDSRLVAVNAVTGATLWNVSCPGAGNLVISNGMLYASGPGYLYAFDISNGNVKWSFAVSPNSGFISQPVAKDGAVYVAAHSSSSVWEGYLYAVDASTGTKKWQLKFDGRVAEIKYKLVGKPVLYGNRIYLSVASQPQSPRVPDRILAVDVASGSTVWQKTDVAGNVVLADDTGIYGFSGPSLWKLNKADGAVIWSAPSNYGSEPTLVNDKIYITNTPTNQQELVVLNAANGIKADGLIGQYGAPYWPYLVVVKDGKTYYPSSSGMNTF